MQGVESGLNARSPQWREIARPGFWRNARVNRGKQGISDSGFPLWKALRTRNIRSFHPHTLPRQAITGRARPVQARNTAHRTPTRHSTHMLRQGGVPSSRITDTQFAAAIPGNR